MLKFISFFKRACSEFLEDDCLSSGAAIAYYAIFSLPPLMVVVFSLATFAGASQDRINTVVREQLGIPGSDKPSDTADDKEQGNSAAIQFQSVAKRAGDTQFGGISKVGGYVGILVLIFASTGFFAQLQSALNRVWDVNATSQKNQVRHYLGKRLLSLGMILVVALLLLGMMVASAVLARTIHLVRGELPAEVVQFGSFLLDQMLTMALATLMFAVVFRFLPDASLKWKDVLGGAAFTATLFVVGKAFIAWYLQRTNLGASWGDATGSIIALLAWLYYSSLIVLFGAEVTQLWSKDDGGQSTVPG